MTRKEYLEAYEYGYVDALKELLEVAKEIDDTYIIYYIERELDLYKD